MGYYGFGNLGDEMLLKVMRSFLAPHRVIAFPAAFVPNEDALDRLNSFHYLVLGGGGLFNRTPTPPFDTFDQWAAHLKTPISVLGLGVERLDPQFLPAIHHFVQRTDYFVVRDVESQRLIGHPKVRVAPDLTFYQPLPRAWSHSEATHILCGVNLRPLHRGVEAWIEAISDLSCRLRALPFSLVPSYDDREPLAQLVGSWPAQVSPAMYQDLDIVIGTAFHAVVLAIQAGVPVIAINYHPKVRRLMEEVGLGEFVLEWDEPERLRPCFEEALAQREAIRERMFAYTDRAQATLASLLAEVRSTIEARASAGSGYEILTGTVPRVTVLLLCRGASQEEIARTAASIRGQTYPLVETVLVDCPGDAQMTAVISNGQAAARPTSFVSSDQNGKNVLDEVGDYVTWVTAGAWFAEDALALLVKKLETRPQADLVYSDYFVTHDGNIERTVSLRPSAHVRDFRWGPSFLTRRRLAGTLWQVSTQGVARDFPAADAIVHLSQPLLYVPATSGEHNMYLAAIAFGRGRKVAAQELLAQAIEADPDFRQHAQLFEQAFQMFLEAGHNPLVTTDPVMYLADVCTGLPTATRTQRDFARRFVGRASLELAYMDRQQGRWGQTRNSLLRAFWYQPDLLSNRGAVWVLLETVLGRATVESLRTLHNQWRKRL